MRAAASNGPGWVVGILAEAGADVNAKDKRDCR